MRHGHSLGRDGEQRITVERSVDGPDGASVAVLAHHREALQVLVVQHGVGGHHPDRGVGRHPGLHLECVSGDGGGKGLTAQFAGLLQIPGPHGGLPGIVTEP